MKGCVILACLLLRGQPKQLMVLGEILVSRERAPVTPKRVTIFAYFNGQQPAGSKRNLSKEDAESVLYGYYTVSLISTK